jgi:hypothetical protein
MIQHNSDNIIFKRILFHNASKVSLSKRKQSDRLIAIESLAFCRARCSPSASFTPKTVRKSHLKASSHHLPAYYNRVLHVTLELVIGTKKSNFSSSLILISSLRILFDAFICYENTSLCLFSLLIPDIVLKLN